MTLIDTPSYVARLAEEAARTRAAADEAMARRLVLLTEGALIEGVLSGFSQQLTVDLQPSYDRLSELLARYEAVEERMGAGEGDGDIELLEQVAREAGAYAFQVGALAGEALATCGAYMAKVREALQATDGEVEARAQALVAGRDAAMARRAGPLLH